MVFRIETLEISKFGHKNQKEPQILQITQIYLYVKSDISASWTDELLLCANHNELLNR